MNKDTKQTIEQLLEVLAEDKSLNKGKETYITTIVGNNVDYDIVKEELKKHNYIFTKPEDNFKKYENMWKVKKIS